MAVEMNDFEKRVRVGVSDCYFKLTQAVATVIQHLMLLYLTRQKNGECKE